jgi:hypothetical protein
MSLVSEVGSQLVDQSGFADTRDTGDADPVGFSGERKQLLQQLLRLFLVIATTAFNKRDGPAKHRAVAVAYTGLIFLKVRNFPSIFRSNHQSGLRRKPQKSKNFAI